VRLKLASATTWGREHRAHDLYRFSVSSCLQFEPVNARGSVIAAVDHTQSKHIECIHVLVVYVLPPATVSSKLIKLYRVNRIILLRTL
jgi:hypothetical protein